MSNMHGCLEFIVRSMSVTIIIRLLYLEFNNTTIDNSVAIADADNGKMCSTIIVCKNKVGM